MAPPATLDVHRVPGHLLRGLLLGVAACLPVALTSVLPVAPDVVLLVVVALALVHGPTAGALAGLAGGWAVDLVPPGGDPLGAGALAYCAAGAVVGALRRYASWSPLLPLVATALAAAGLQALRGVLALAGVGWATAGTLGVAAVVTVVAGAVLVPLLVALDRAVVERGWG
ncbi:rod shape-determining protein MreD [Ornithinicoccus halotolerans]|uniref:rod shape-determining protein MreD n=1 Tax=Ornithinicoccus halotolerans TaxID=1748220 RepID=UPI001294E9C5|nr:rod shape-determining protein MreD [Ornithinicoccus halotolerans]